MRTFRPTPALLVAVLALVVASGGTGYAAATLTGKDIKNSSLTGKDIKDKSLTAKDFNGSVAGPQGPQGAAGVPGAVRAFGSFTDTGAPTSPARVKNLTARRAAAGSYCLSSSAVAVAASIPVVTIDFTTAPSTDTVAMIRTENNQCLASEWEISVFDASATTAVDSGFSVLIP